MGGYHVCKGRVEDRPCLSVFFLYFLNLSLGIIPLHPSQARLILGSTPGGTRVRIHCACTSKRCMPLDSRHSMWQLISRLQTRCSKKEEKKKKDHLLSVSRLLLAYTKASVLHRDTSNVADQVHALVVGHFFRANSTTKGRLRQK